MEYQGPVEYVRGPPQQRVQYVRAPPGEVMQQHQMQYQPRQYAPQHYQPYALQQQHHHQQHDQMRRAYLPPHQHYFEQPQAAPPQDYGAMFSGLPNREPMLGIQAPSRGAPPGYGHQQNYQQPQGPPSGGEFAQGIDI